MAFDDWTVTKRYTPVPAPLGDPKSPQDPNRPSLFCRVDFHFVNTVTGASFDYHEDHVSVVDAKAVDALAFAQLRQIETVSAVSTDVQPVDVLQFLPATPKLPTDEEVTARARQDAYVRAKQRTLLLKEFIDLGQLDASDAAVVKAKAALDAAAAPLIAAEKAAIEASPDHVAVLDFRASR